MYQNKLGKSKLCHFSLMPSEEINRNLFRIKYYFFACVDAKSIISRDRNIKKRKFLIFECEIMLYALCQNLLCSSGSGSFFDSLSSFTHSKNKVLNDNYRL